MGRGGRLAGIASLRRATPVAREHLPRTVASVGAARLLVGDVLEAQGVSDRSVLDTAVLLASELATDGVRHGSGPDLLIEVALASGLVQLTVTVGAAVRPAPSAPGVAEHSQQVLDILASAWEVRTFDGVRTGWCRVDRPTTGMMPAVRGADGYPEDGGPDDGYSGDGYRDDHGDGDDPDGTDPDDPDGPDGPGPRGGGPSGGRAGHPAGGRPTLRRIK